MAREKPKWRRVLNARYLRWRLLGALCRAVPALGRALAFFPDHVGMIEGADRVLCNTAEPVPADTLAPHMPFLSRCAPWDSRAPDAVLPGGAVTGRRTALFSRPWIDATNGSVLLPKSARTVLVRGEIANWNATSARPGRPRIAILGRAFAPLVTANYFHVLLENAVRTLDLLDSGLIDDAPLTIVTQPSVTNVETAFYLGLQKLYPDVRVQQVPDGALVEPDEAVVHFPPDNYWEWPPVDRVGADRLAAVFEAVYGDAARAGGTERLYLTRKGAKLREPLNAAALEEALASRGFGSFTASDANHAAQIAAFRAARTVVSVHGAGLTNLLFCRPGARVVEIFPGNFVKSPYWRLAQSLDLVYRPVFGGPGDYDQRFEADIDAVLAALED